MIPSYKLQQWQMCGARRRRRRRREEGGGDQYV
jgi:hypothetical protein